MREAVMNDPARGRVMAFLERIPMFCTPAQAIDHLKALGRSGFQHFIVGGTETRTIERFASQVMKPLLEGAA
ncbi:MAG: hypothetical protein ACYDB4_11030 [Candidatus Dormibacteraceae bacterium]